MSPIVTAYSEFYRVLFGFSPTQARGRQGQRCGMVAERTPEGEARPGAILWLRRLKGRAVIGR